MIKDLSTHSLYIHFPYCKRKCRYCDFYSVPYKSNCIDSFITALKKERKLLYNKYQLHNSTISTLYIGGGTPSLLSVEQWDRLYLEVLEELKRSSKCEFSLECNPESFSKKKANAWLKRGVNRITIGVQSLNDRELRILGRHHDRESVLYLLNNSILKEFNSIGVDIMYGLPEQTLESLKDTLELILPLKHITHLSIYELTISDKTPFGQHKKLLPLPLEDEMLDMTNLILSFTKKYHFKRYEVSNYAREDYKSLHNWAYWNHLPYLGLGPSAHSYIHPIRFSNFSDIDKYLNLLSKNELPCNYLEEVDTNAFENEIILLGLRTCCGINESHFFDSTGKPFNTPVRDIILKELLELKLMEYNPPFWKLSEKGLNYTDAIVRKLIS